MSIDVTFILAAVIVAIAAAYLKRALFNPVGSLLDARAAKLKDDAAERTRALTTIEERILAYNARLTAARKSAFEQREAARRSAMEARGGILDAARDAATETTAQGKAEVKGAADGARTQLASEAELMAQAIASRILGRSVRAASN